MGCVEHEKIMGIRGQYKNKRDANETIIFDLFRAHGIQVYPLDTPCDAICAYRNTNYLVEIKNGTKAKLTDAQELFQSTWRGQYVVISTKKEAEAWVREIKDNWQSIGSIAAGMLDGEIS